MNNSILSQNQNKKLDQPFWMLLCFAMFCFWQMGFIYFMGPALTIDGRTPLPISMDNVTILIVVCYILSILWMIFLPKTVIWTQRIATSIALLSAIGLFIPLPDDVLRVLIYIHIFCCCLMIGFEAFIMVNFFSETSNIKHLTAAYGIAFIMIAFVQNDFFPITFPIFRIVTVIALIFLLTFFIRMPANKEALPHYVKKEDGFTAPKKFLFGTYLLTFVSAIMAVSGPSISGEVEHGVFITYFVDALVSIAMWVLYKKANIHPFKPISICIGLGCIGFLLMYAATYVPALTYVACGFIGFGMVPCQMLPLYGAALMKSYPSKYISPIIIGLSLVAVLVQTSMVEIFRGASTMLCLAYAVVMVILVILYLQIAPYFLYSVNKKIPVESVETENVSDNEAIEETTEDPKVSVENTEEDPMKVLSKREREVVELICLGYTNADIAKLLFISEHTVKDHTKKIYPKMGVHSRLELAALVSKLKK